MRFQLSLCLVIPIIVYIHGDEVIDDIDTMWNSHMESIARMKRAAVELTSYEQDSNKDILNELNLDADDEHEQTVHSTRAANLEDRLDTLIQRKPNVLNNLDQNE